jgi:hypothetical protein
LATLLPDLATRKPDLNISKIATSAISNPIDSPSNNPARWNEILAENLLLKAILARLIKDKTILDLGAGVNWSDMHKLVKELGAKKYIGVDKFFSFNNSRDFLEERPDPTCPIVLVKWDMLGLASHIKDSSCCVIADAIDGAIIPSYQYQQALAAEIQRIVPPDGFAMSTISILYLFTGDDTKSNDTTTTKGFT